MKALIQRVNFAQVQVAKQTLSKISTGILVFLAVEKEDSQAKAEKMLHKILNYRIFTDSSGKLNLSLKQIEGELLIVSQFTLAADTAKGLRPSFSPAASPAEAEQIYNFFVRLAREKHDKVADGRFATNMQVSLENDGPLTFLLEI